MKRDLICGARSALPVCLGIIPVGISYGLLAVQAGMSLMQTELMSVAVMAGSSQLMAVGMVGHAAVGSIIMAVFFVNLRHIVMSCCIMERLGKASVPMKLLCAFALCDESFALFALSGSTSASRLLGANTALYLVWVLSSLAGAVLGGVLPEAAAKSFGVAFYAAFLSMLTPNAAKNRRILYLILMAAAVNTALRCFVPVSWAIIIAMLVSAAAGTLLRGWLRLPIFRGRSLRSLWTN